MVARHIGKLVQERLSHLPAVTLLGPRQVGKTTLARSIAATRDNVYLDLESPIDREKLSDPVFYLSGHEDKLVILDEVQRMPELFAALRGLIDTGRRHGRTAGRFLLLGSASVDLLRQSETLAGRIAYIELSPFDVLETPEDRQTDLWVRGGFPESFLASDPSRSLIWRQAFIRTYLERDIPQLGPRIPATTLNRFWTMLAHVQGGLGGIRDGESCGCGAAFLRTPLLPVSYTHLDVYKRQVLAVAEYLPQDGELLVGTETRQFLMPRMPC